MTIVSRQAIVPHSAMDMFILVDHVEKYPDFLPWCAASHVISRNPDEVRATLTLSKSGIRKSFTTCNRLQPGKMIEIRLIDGPFRHLEGFWRFDELAPGHCKVALDLEFEFSNKLISLALNGIFSQIADTLVDAFQARAKAVYGPR